MVTTNSRLKCSTCDEWAVDTLHGKGYCALHWAKAREVEADGIVRELAETHADSFHVLEALIVRARLYADGAGDKG